MRTVQKTQRFDSIKRTREHLDHMIVGFAVGLGGVFAGIVAVCVKQFA